jgi:hypothetical protein
MGTKRLANSSVMVRTIVRGRPISQPGGVLLFGNGSTRLVVRASGEREQADKAERLETLSDQI